MPNYKFLDDNVKLFGQEAILSVHEKRKPDYDSIIIKNRFRPISPALSTVYSYNDKNDDDDDEMDVPLLGKKCFCYIL